MVSNSERETDTGISLASEVVIAEYYRKTEHFAQSNHSHCQTDPVQILDGAPGRREITRKKHSNNLTAERQMTMLRAVFQQAS